MQHEVIVVGGGIGGLTTAALLAARGVDVCLFERQSQVGGCIADYEHLGYSFELTGGLYSGWGSAGTWSRIFSELPLAPPPITKLSPNYVVRLPGGCHVAVIDDRHTFEANLTAAFAECAGAAIQFFERLDRIRREGSAEVADPVASLLQDTSRSFRSFIDAQLQTFAQQSSADCPVLQAANALNIATGSLWSIDGGGQSLADCLASSLKKSGGRLRLDSPVLRLAYRSDGTPNGVDLLSGERVIATRAIVSNLTIWDTYGKLIGLSRTSRTIAAQLRKLSAWGAYLIFVGVDEVAAVEIPQRLLLVYEADGGAEYDPANQQLVLNLGPPDNARAPVGKRAMTVWAFTDAEAWFAFHEDATAHEERDQVELEKCWALLHAAIPALGNRAEVIETATPVTFYETTRRKFGMIGAPFPSSSLSSSP